MGSTEFSLVTISWKQNTRQNEKSDYCSVCDSFGWNGAPSSPLIRFIQTIIDNVADIAFVFSYQAVLAAPSSVDISIDELPDSDATNKLGINLEFIQCAFYAIEHAVNDTPYQTIWAKYAPALVKTMESFVNCVDLENNHEYGSHIKSIAFLFVAK